MHRTALSAVMAGFVVLLGIAAPTGAQARTEKELNICWVNRAPGGVLDLEVVADGPSYKSASLDQGECLAWDVRPGQYKITVEDVREFRNAMDASCTGKKKSPELTIAIRRQQDHYKTNLRALRTAGGIETNVRKDRRTTVTFVLTCVVAKI